MSARLLVVAACSLIVYAVPSGGVRTGVRPVVIFTHERSIFVRPLVGGPWHRISDPLAKPRGYATTDFGTPYYYWAPDGKRLVLVPGFLAPLSTAAVLAPSGRLLHAVVSDSEGATGLGATALYGPFWAADADRLVYESVLAASPARISRPLIEGITAAGRRWRLWPRGVRAVGAKNVCQLQGVSSPPDPVNYLFSAEEHYLSRFVQWDALAHVMVYLGCHGTWRLVDTRTGRSHSLPFSWLSRVDLSDTGLIAGTTGRGRVVIVDSRHPSRWNDVGRGYEPAWSPDGHWLFYVSRNLLRMLTFKMQWQPPVRYPPPWFPKWYTVRSPVYRVSILRIASDGTRRRVMTSQPAFAFAQLNVLSDDRSVVFTRIPSDVNLWRHRAERLTIKRVARYGPHMDIEITRAGSRPSILIPNSHLASVQPTTPLERKR